MLTFQCSKYPELEVISDVMTDEEKDVYGALQMLMRRERNSLAGIESLQY